MSEIDEATDRVLMGPAKTSRKITEKEKRLVSIHEAGHAVIGLKLQDAQEVHKITIIPRGMAGGYTMMLPKEEKIGIATKKELEASITGLLGGRTAEEITFGEITTGAHNDFEKAISLRVIDSHWMNHISTMSHLREGVGLRGYANENPLQAYTLEGYELFDSMMNIINKEVSMYLLKSEIRQNIERKQVVKGEAKGDRNKTKKAEPKIEKAPKVEPQKTEVKKEEPKKVEKKVVEPKKVEEKKQAKPEPKKAEVKKEEPKKSSPNLAPTQPKVLERAVVENIKEHEDVL